jgi:hypothetical protein
MAHAQSNGHWALRQSWSYPVNYLSVALWYHQTSTPGDTASYMHSLCVHCRLSVLFPFHPLETYTITIVESPRTVSSLQPPGKWLRGVSVSGTTIFLFPTGYTLAVQPVQCVLRASSGTRTDGADRSPPPSPKSFTCLSCARLHAVLNA